jgi:hypothetical protein
MTAMAVMGTAKFERFFRLAASLDVDKDDLRRYEDFVNQNVTDLLIRGQASAKANLRDVVEPIDLPITKGLQEQIHEFRRIDQDVGLRPLLDELTIRPAIDMAIGDETDAELPEIVGGVSVALSRTFKIIDHELKNPQTEHWERSFRLFDLLL